MPDPELFQNKYRVRSTRLSDWDYSENGSYFVTICTEDRKMFFGEIFDYQMYLSKIGKIANKFWLEIPQHFDFVNLDEFAIMPNHLHGVVDIDRSIDFSGRDAINRVSTGGITKSKNPMLGESLGRIIRWYKGRVSYEVNKKFPQINFSWQSGFYEYIIRGEKDLDKIRDYVINNSANWVEDKNNPENFE